jgi:hypothetical protein
MAGGTARRIPSRQGVRRIGALLLLAALSAPELVKRLKSTIQQQEKG